MPSLSPEGTKNAGNSENEQRIQGYLLSLLPAMKSWHNMSHSLSNINHLPRSSSVQKLKSSLGMSTILRSMSIRKNVNRNNNDDMESVGHNNRQGGWSKLKKEQEKLKPDDSLWTKTIILGETCKVPEDDEVVLRQQREEDPIVLALGLLRDQYPSVGLSLLFAKSIGLYCNWCCARIDVQSIG